QRDRTYGSLGVTRDARSARRRRQGPDDGTRELAYGHRLFQGPDPAAAAVPRDRRQLEQVERGLLVRMGGPQRREHGRATRTRQNQRDTRLRDLLDLARRADRPVG